MSNFFISTGAMSAASRAAVIEGQGELAKKQREIATGKKADMGLEIGYRASELVVLQQVLDQATAIKSSNAIVASRLESSQAALTDIDKLASEFLDGLLVARRSSPAASPIEAQSRALLNALVSHLNSDVGGEHIFGGLNIIEQPCTDYMAAGGSAARSSIQAAFVSTFGISSSDPAVVNIEPGAMAAFLDGEFAAEFEDTAWTDRWTKASTENRTARIGIHETQEVGASASEAPFRQIVMALVMVGDLGKAINQETRAVVLDKATGLIGNAITGIASVRSRLGLAQERITSAEEHLSLQVHHATARRSEIEVADSFTTATELNDIMRRLEASYAATSRIQRLSLLNYL